MQRFQWPFFPSSGNDTAAAIKAPDAEKPCSTGISSHVCKTETRTFNPERAGNTRQQSVWDWGGESWNVLTTLWCHITHRHSWWKRRPDLLVCDRCGRTWFHSGWEQGEWP